jgi:hypothetical protein
MHLLCAVREQNLLNMIDRVIHAGQRAADCGRGSS